MHKPTRFAFAAAMATLVTAGPALAESAFIHFEDYAQGFDVSGPGKVHPDLDIEALNPNGTPIVIETGYGAHGDPAQPFGYSGPNFAPVPNNCLEDRDGNRVELAASAPTPYDATAKGFTVLQNYHMDVAQELKFTFNGRKVKRFSILMTDFGDFNISPSGTSEFHEFGLWGWSDSNAGYTDLTSADASHVVSYHTSNLTNPTTSWDADYGQLYYNSDACAPTDGVEHIGHIHLTVENDAGLGAVYLLVPAGSDPHVGFDSISFDFADLTVPVDIKPMSCPNPINVDQNGVVPIAILGTADFDVTQIDPSTVRLEGVEPLRWAYEDVTTPHQRDTSVVDAYDCNVLGPDGFTDLTFKFKQKELAAALGTVNDRDVLVLHVTGQLKDGTEFNGDDVVIILSKQ